MEYLDMGSFTEQPVRQLSLGQRMRAEIAASLLHDPKVLFLDEPTIGLDVNVKVAVREFVKKINKERGVTVLLTTHDLQDIEELARRAYRFGFIASFLAEVLKICVMLAVWMAVYRQRNTIAGFFIMFSVSAMSGLLAFWLMNNWGLLNLKITYTYSLLIHCLQIPRRNQTIQKRSFCR